MNVWTINVATETNNVFFFLSSELLFHACSLNLEYPTILAYWRILFGDIALITDPDKGKIEVSFLSG